ALPVAQADLNETLPIRARSFDAAMCALVGEHLTRPVRLFRELHTSLVPAGRLVFSVFHPEMAAAGIEANFERDGVEYRLGADRLTKYARLVGRENVVAGTDCGLGPRVGHPKIARGKFEALVEGARQATRQLWK